MVGSWWEIPYERYLSDALMLSAVEQARLAAALDCLPAEIIDAHTHVARSIDVVALSPSALTHVISTYPCYTLEDGRRARERLWPGKRVRALRMAYPIEGYRHRDINEYLVANANLYEDIVGGYGIPDDINYTLQLIDSGHIHALKMYYRYREPGVDRILDIFPAPILQQAQGCGIPIILHLPRPLPQCLDELIAVLDSFPQLTVVLAHLGGPGGQRFDPIIVPAYERLARYSRVYMDTAFVLDADLIANALQLFGHERILFGTDEPLSLIRGVNYLHPIHGHRLYAPEYHWSQDDAPPTEMRRATPTLLHIQQVEAVLTALRSFSCDAVNAVFYRNAAQLFGLAPHGTV